MGGIEKRLAQLEGWAGALVEDEEERVRRETLRRVTTEDLKIFVGYLRRAKEEAGEPTEGEQEALRRYEELREEVRNEFRTTPQ